MFYQNLKFPKVKGRPFFYTNFVQTVDGKVQVLKNTNDYWPIGSKVDHDVLVELRAYADCLIHGKNLGLEFGEVTLKNLNKPDFKNLRKKLGKKPYLPYYILNRKNSIKSLISELNKKGYIHVLVEGGPTLLASFLKENLIDQIFLTIAPKIFGNENSSTLTLVENYLFPKKEIKNLSLLSVKRIKNELFLHYKVEN